ncbi:MAG TPA: alpha/beta hydrolase [Gaiellaceae bacterium]|nr:alpha/beta hydrolase [Gaiellaceae bacterium]
MHARELGDGPPVVLLHGYGVSGTYMLPLARQLAGDYRVLVPELPGQGASEPRPGLRSVPELADAFAAWLDAAELDRPAAVANSLGCQIVTELAAREPERLGPLVLVGPTVDPARRGGRHQLFAALRDSAQEPLQLVAIAAADDLGVGLRRLVATARAALDDRIEDRLALVQQPTVVVRGGADPFVGADWAERVASLLPDGRLVVVPGEPHAVHFTRPDVVARVVREFLLEESGDLVGDRGRLLQHRHVAARQQLQPRVGNEALPLLGDP